MRITTAVLLAGFGLCRSALKIVQAVFYGARIRTTHSVDVPVFIVGHRRSGTTLLHELLGCDPNHTFPSTFTAFAPDRFLLTERFLKHLIRLALPNGHPMDNIRIDWDTPHLERIYERPGPGDFEVARPRIREYVAGMGWYRANCQAMDDAPRKQIVDRLSGSFDRYGFSRSSLPEVTG